MLSRYQTSQNIRPIIIGMQMFLHIMLHVIKFAVFLPDCPLSNSKFYKIEMSLFPQTSVLNIIQFITYNSFVVMLKSTLGLTLTTKSMYGSAIKHVIHKQH